MSAETEPQEENPQVETNPAPEAPLPAEPKDDKLLRLMADFDNFRRRSQKEKAQERLRGRREAVERLLPVLDSVTSGLQTIGLDNPARAGMQGVLQQALSAFEALGLTRIPGVGTPFDPAVHEAIAHVASATVKEGVIVQEARPGFRDEAGLIRASQVVVSSGPG